MKIAVSGEERRVKNILFRKSQSWSGDTVRRLSSFGRRIFLPVPAGPYTGFSGTGILARRGRFWKKKELLPPVFPFGGAFDRSIAGDEALYSEELARAVDAAGYLGAEYVNHYLYYLFDG